MDTMSIARQLVDLCRQGKNDEALTTLFTADAVSVEAGAPPGQDAVSKGLDAIRAKGSWWRDNHDVHSGEITGPWPNGNRFIVGFKFDVTFKPTSQRMTMEEAALYTVEGGKIVREEFFYSM